MTARPEYVAIFDRDNHCIRVGWATYMKPLARPRERVCQRVFGHVLPEPPWPPDGYSPSNYESCERCGAALKWYIVDQHRYGSLAKS